MSKDGKEKSTKTNINIKENVFISDHFKSQLHYEKTFLSEVQISFQ